MIIEPWHEISINVIYTTSNGSDQPAYTRTLIRAFAGLEYSMSVKLLTEHHSEFLSLKGGCTCSSESILVKMPLCWKSHVTAQFFFFVSVSESCIRLLDMDGDGRDDILFGAENGMDGCHQIGKGIDF